MALPLQPDLRPHPPWLRRALVAATVVASLLLLGAVNGAQQRPELVLSGPGHEYEYARAVERLIAQSTKRVWVMMYVVQIGEDGPAMQLLNALAEASKRGVRVQICLDIGRVRGAEDLDPKHVEPEQWLKDRGIKVILDEMDRTSHSKVVVIDDACSVIGSQNWTYSAMTQNREAAVIFNDAAMARQIEDEMFATIPGWDMNY